jgi:hypothetical protein
MAFHDDLLQPAIDLVNPQPIKLNQASLRRGVSTAYYALFHLLISETVANWSKTSSRDALGRMFDHALMRKVSSRISDANKEPFKGEDPMVVQNLRSVASTFVLLQDKRHIADYDNGTRWTQTEAREEVKKAAKAYTTWRLIRNQDITQDYLVRLLIKPRD